MAGKLLITGARGQLGSELARHFSPEWTVIELGREELDILNRAAVRECLSIHRPDWVLHAAAYTDVDGCETKAGMAMAVNADGAGHVAKACAVTGARMLYYSTDYVFDGDKESPYTEDDLPDPQTVYGQSKLAGEEQIQRAIDDHVILRIAWLYGGPSRNFVSAMMAAGQKQASDRAQGRSTTPLRVVADQFGNPTWAREIARQTEAIINSGLEGLFHAGAEGAVSRYEFAREIFTVSRMSVDLQPCRTEESPRPARRPRNSALENRRLQQAGINLMRPWRGPLTEFLTQHYPVTAHG